MGAKRGIPFLPRGSLPSDVLWDLAPEASRGREPSTTPRGGLKSRPHWMQARINQSSCLHAVHGDDSSRTLKCNENLPNCAESMVQQSCMWPRILHRLFPTRRAALVKAARHELSSAFVTRVDSSILRWHDVYTARLT